MDIRHNRDIDSRERQEQTPAPQVQRAESENERNREQALSRYRDLSREIRSRELSATTQKEYIQCEKRLSKEGVRDNSTLIAYCEKHQISQNQYYVLRASLEQKVAREFKRHDKQGNRAEALYAGRRLESLRPGKPYDPKNMQQKPDYAGDKSELNSRRHDKLPESWRDRAIRSARNNEARERMSVLALSGCRPAELKKGVKIDVRENEISFHVTGAKKHGDISGRDREVVAKKEEYGQSEAWKTLQKKGEGSHEIKATSYDVIKKDMARVHEATGMDISAYSFRHQFATDQRQHGQDKEATAEKMGHRALRSQDAYGHKIPS
ncbi:MAG: site-specific integrase [Leptospirales bacterium]